MASKPSQATSGNNEDPQTAAVKTRIISHMNADHSSSLSLYLQYYCCIPASHADSAKLTDVALDHLIIESTFGRNLIPIDPPMKSYAEARERLVEMNRASLEGLGLSDIVVQEWRPPRNVLHVGSFVICLLMFISLPRRANFTPEAGGVFYQLWSLGGRVPVLAKLCYNLQPILLPVMLLIHGFEVYTIVTTRLKKHQVRVGSSIWLLWVVDNFIEGFGCFQRFDQIVKEKQELKNSRKH